MDYDWVWVDNQIALENARDTIQNSSLIGVDTEYDSFRYFREKLCLIQIISGDTTYLFDPFERLDLSFLGDVFANSTIQKIMHAGDNDARILNRDYGFVFKNIFDTYRAASLLGCTHLSLSNVVCQYLGVNLNKSKRMQRSQWENRPLTSEQLDYAVRDTRYLMDLYYALKSELEKEALEERAWNAFRAIEGIRWREKTLDPEGYLKIKGAQDLDVCQQKRLQALFYWRFEKARETNRARFMILSDQNLIDLSTEPFNSISTLLESEILSSQKVHDFGFEIVETLTGIHD